MPVDTNDATCPAVAETTESVTTTSLVPALAITRAAMFTASPETSSPRRSTSPTWMPMRTRRSSTTRSSRIRSAARTATPADGNNASTPSPVVFTTRPLQLPTALRTERSWRSMRTFQLASPMSAALRVESTRSVNSTAANSRSGGGTRRSPRMNSATSATTASTSPTNGQWSSPSISTFVACGSVSTTQSTASAGT